ncbi:MAG TPA: 3-methyl-2-oxobutanoate hydroxymethyltransferase [Actinomycetales bacterium]|nr:3-methyl-2-oxobutanoate hydroxymethyltransferase [Actinomycetales bacterium]
MSTDRPAIDPKRVRVHHLAQMKEASQPITMLTAYEQFTAEIFGEAGIDVLLVGDSAGDNVFAHETTIPVTLDEMIPLVRAVARRAKRPLVVADLPFGTYHASPEQALASSVRLLKEGLAHAVKFEGGTSVLPQVRALTGAGIAFMGHLGFTPQAEHALGGKRVQGRDDGGDRMVDEALALQEAGAFAVVLELVPAPVAERVTKALDIPTIGIGAGGACDGQVLVWTDLAGLTTFSTRYSKKYADLRGTLLDAARTYADEVRTGTFPAPENSFLE